MAVIALLGSGEFEPWARAVDEWCAQRASAPSERVLIVPTASAPEGEDVFQRWGTMGLAHYRALGLAPEVVPLRARADANDPAIVEAVTGARIVFFSGGNPGYLAETLAGTPFWEAVLSAIADGTAIGGCSAGASFLGNLAPFIANDMLDRWVPGLGVLARAFVMPHFDALDGYFDGLRGLMLRARPVGSVALGIDENTALFGDGETWQVIGAGAAWAGDGSEDEPELTPTHDGETRALPLGLTVP